MNEKFYKLPPEKQKRIIEAGFQVFSQSSYKKSPVGEIASMAGISKSLLFHYFHNKKELYLFLWNHAASISMQHLAKCGCYGSRNLFVMLEQGMQAKLYLIRQYPAMSTFVIRAYYETDPEIAGEIQKSYRSFLGKQAAQALELLDPADFRPGLDLRMMYQEMLYASEGYVWKFLQSGGSLDADRFEKDFSEMIQFWKQIFLPDVPPPAASEKRKKQEYPL